MIFVPLASNSCRAHWSHIGWSPAEMLSLSNKDRPFTSQLKFHNTFKPQHSVRVAFWPRAYRCLHCASWDWIMTKYSSQSVAPYESTALQWTCRNLSILFDDRQHAGMLQGMYCHVIKVCRNGGCKHLVQDLWWQIDGYHVDLSWHTQQPQSTFLLGQNLELVALTEILKKFNLENCDLDTEYDTVLWDTTFACVLHVWDVAVLELCAFKYSKACIMSRC